MPHLASNPKDTNHHKPPQNGKVTKQREHLNAHRRKVLKEHPLPKPPQNGKVIKDKNLMEHRKLFRIMYDLSTKEIDLLDHYLASPLLGNSKTCRRFLSLYRKLILGGNGQTPAVDFYRQLYPGKQPSSKWQALLNNLQTKFLNHLMEFMAFSIYQQDEDKRRLYQLDAIRKNLTPDLYFKEAMKTRRSTRHREGVQKIWFDYQLETSWNEFVAGNNLQSHPNRLEQVLEAQDQLFMLEKLKYACAALNDLLLSNKTVNTNEKQEVRFIKEILIEIDSDPSQVLLVIQAYANCYKMLRELVYGSQDRLYAKSEGCFPYFQKLRALLSRAHDLDKNEALDLYTYALNFCTLHYDKGILSDLSIQEYKTMIEEMLELQLIQENGSIARNYLKNITTIMNKYGELEWVESFLNRFYQKVVDDPDGYYWAYNMVTLKFHQGKFPEALTILRRSFFPYHCKDDFYRIGAKIYEIKSLYEIEDHQMLESRIDALRMELSRKLNIDRSLNAIYFKFYTYIYRLNRICSEIDPKRTTVAKEMYADIMGSGDQHQLRWFLEKLDKIIG